MSSQQINRDKYLYLFADCFLVKGASRSLICDISRSRLYFIDNSFAELMDVFKSYRIAEIIEMLESPEDIPEMEKFMDFLISNELATTVDDLSLFPPLDVTWHHPSQITNAVIDIADGYHDFEDIFRQLDELGCYFIQLRFYRAADYDRLCGILRLMKNTNFRSVQILTAYDPEISEAQWLEVGSQFPAVDSITIHSAPFEKYVPHAEHARYSAMGDLLYITQEINSCESCGNISLKTLNIPDIKTFAEQINFNGCLNRKLSIDINGAIKNCPSMQHSFGSVKDIPLKEVMELPAFQELWHINKDKIAVCKDCEFRYLCSDCRAYIEKPEDLYSKPAKCRYNPYTAQWEN